MDSKFIKIALLCLIIPFTVFSQTPVYDRTDQTLRLTSDGIIKKWLNKDTIGAKLNEKINYKPIKSKGLIIGNSTIAATLGDSGIDVFLQTSADSLLGSTIKNQAVPGNTINQQLTIFNADPDKSTYDWYIVEIGLNDVGVIADPPAVIIARYQNLINQINAVKKKGAIVIGAIMTPARQRWINSMGPTDGAVAYNSWKSLNAAILGMGVSPILGLDFRIQNHSLALNDGLDNLAKNYDTHADNIHPSNAGREIIAAEYRNILNKAGFLTVQAPKVYDLNFTKINNVLQLKSGSLTVPGSIFTQTNIGIDAPTFSNRGIYLFTNGVRRWAITKGQVGESGSNTGSPLNFIRYADNGDSLGVSLQMDRLGNVKSFNTPSTASDVINKGYADVNYLLVSSIPGTYMRKLTSNLTSAGSLDSYTGNVITSTNPIASGLSYNANVISFAGGNDGNDTQIASNKDATPVMSFRTKIQGTGTWQSWQTLEVQGNKQNSLTADGTNLKYPTVTAVNTGLGLKADLASPALTGIPTAPTATLGTNTTQIASTAFVQQAITANTAQIVDVAGTTQSLSTGNTYIFHNTSTAITASLPANPASNGGLITIIVDGVGRVKITQGASQFIVSGGATSTVGTTGYVQTSTNNATLTLRYINTNKWSVTSSNSTPTIF